MLPIYTGFRTRPWNITALFLSVDLFEAFPWVTAGQLRTILLRAVRAGRFEPNTPAIGP